MTLVAALKCGDTGAMICDTSDSRQITTEHGQKMYHGKGYLLGESGAPQLNLPVIRRFQQSYAPDLTDALSEAMYASKQELTRDFLHKKAPSLQVHGQQLPTPDQIQEMYEKINHGEYELGSAFEDSTLLMLTAGPDP
ncbi:MAG: hypothetical protein ACOCWQ_04750, partial [Nanoarchaeota archaeon]